MQAVSIMEELRLLPANFQALAGMLIGCTFCNARQIDVLKAIMATSTPNATLISVKMHCPCRSGGVQSVWHLSAAPDTLWSTSKVRPSATLSHASLHACSIYLPGTCLYSIQADFCNSSLLYLGGVTLYIGFCGKLMAT